MRATPISPPSPLRRPRPPSNAQIPVVRDIATACRRSKYHPPSVGAFTRTASAPLVMLIQLGGRLGQGFRVLDCEGHPRCSLADEVIE
jgi:hypothetical protein